MLRLYKSICKTIIFDNGGEFADHASTAQFLINIRPRKALNYFSPIEFLSGKCVGYCGNLGIKLKYFRYGETCALLLFCQLASLKTY